MSGIAWTCLATCACCVPQAEPLSGGHLLGAGRLWVAPEAETDPRAVRVQVTGKDLPTESLVRAYLPQVQRLFVAVARSICMQWPSGMMSSSCIQLLPGVNFL